MKRFLCRAFALAAALGVLVAAVPEARAGEMPGKFKIGDTAPDFTLPSLAGQTVQLSKFAGSKVVLLAFWSVRCGACLAEVPFLNQIHAAWATRGVTVISVVTDGMDAETTQSLLKEIGTAPAYPVLLDQEFTASDTYTNFVVPHTLVIDRKGVIRYVHTGFEAGVEKQYEAALAAALGS